jgi:undecaprenyl diphosphate synthase
VSTENRSAEGQEATVPCHVVIIPDGNRRWAAEKGVPVMHAYERAVDRVMELLRTCRDEGVQVFTFWGFSTENWLRPESDLDAVMELAARVVSDESTSRDFSEAAARFVHLGRKDRLTGPLVRAIAELERATSANTGCIFNLAMDYGGRDEILRAVSRMLERRIEPSDLGEATFESFLDTKRQPDPDLIIRTSGEQRLSGVLPWQSCYAELYFDETLFPDYTSLHLLNALAAFEARTRRYGR